MVCTYCGADNRADAIFCAKCGVKVETEQEISATPISRSLPKLFGGILLIDLFILIGALSAYFFIQDFFMGLGILSGILSIIGCWISYQLVKRFMIKKSGTLVILRWGHFWNGNVLGYWPIYIIGRQFLTAANTILYHGGIRQGGMLWEVTFSFNFLIYAIACLFGLAVGFINVYINDMRDKQKVISIIRGPTQGGEDLDQEKSPQKPT